MPLDGACNFILPSKKFKCQHCMTYVDPAKLQPNKVPFMLGVYRAQTDSWDNYCGRALPPCWNYAGVLIPEQWQDAAERYNTFGRHPAQVVPPQLPAADGGTSASQAKEARLQAVPEDLRDAMQAHRAMAKEIVLTDGELRLAGQQLWHSIRGKVPRSQTSGKLKGDVQAFGERFPNAPLVYAPSGIECILKPNACHLCPARPSRRRFQNHVDTQTHALTSIRQPVQTRALTAIRQLVDTRALTSV